MLNKLTKIKRLLLIGKEIWHNKRSMRAVSLFTCCHWCCWQVLLC